MDDVIEGLLLAFFLAGPPPSLAFFPHVMVYSLEFRCVSLNLIFFRRSLQLAAPTPDPFAQCVLYFRLKASTALAMKSLDTASEGVRLWVSYCQHVGKEDDFHGRFKVRLRLLSFYIIFLTRSHQLVLFYFFNSPTDGYHICVVLSLSRL